MPDVSKQSVGQKAAEAEVRSFHDHLGPFVVAAETTRMAMVFTNATAPDNHIIFANDAFLALTGYERGEVLGKSFNFLLAHVADAEEQAAKTTVKLVFPLVLFIFPSLFVVTIGPSMITMMEGFSKYLS